MRVLSLSATTQLHPKYYWFPVKIQPTNPSQNLVVTAENVGCVCGCTLKCIWEEH